MIYTLNNNKENNEKESYKMEWRNSGHATQIYI